MKKEQPVFRFVVSSTSNRKQSPPFDTDGFQERSLSEFLTLMACKGPFEIIPPKEVFETQYLPDSHQLENKSVYGAWTILFHLKREE